MKILDLSEGIAKAKLKTSQMRLLNIYHLDKNECSDADILLRADYAYEILTRSLNKKNHQKGAGSVINIIVNV